MPLKKTRQSGASKPKNTVNEDANQVSIPEGKLTPSDNLSDYNIMIYGDSGVGKTSLAAQFDKCLVLQTEPRQNGLEIWALPVPYIGVEKYSKIDRRPFIQIGNALEQAMEDDRVKSVAIDTFNLFWQSAQDHICWSKGATHPNDIENDWGKTWREIKEAVRNTLLLYKESGKTLVLVDHSVQVEVTLAGHTFLKTMPNLSDTKNGGLQVVKEMTDLILYYGVDDHGRRYLQVDTTQEVYCKNAIDHHFLSPKGEKITKFWAGQSPKDAYDSLVAAFNNEVENIKEESPLKKKNK
jgi:hypothetical protein